MTDKSPKEVNRCTAERWQASVLQLLRGETTPAESERKYGMDAGIVGRRFVRFPRCISVGIEPVAI